MGYLSALDAHLRQQDSDGWQAETRPLDGPGRGSEDVPAERIPILPRTYLDRARLSDSLEAGAAGAVTLLVAPAGAGKTLGVAGWLHHTGRAADATWIKADRSWTPELLAAVLGRRHDKRADAREIGREPRADLVVLDNAQDLPAATIRYLERWLNDEPEPGIRVLLLSRRDLPLNGLIPQMLGQLTVIRGDVLRLSRSEVARLVADHARTKSSSVAEAIADRSDGWCAAAVLMARAVAVAPDKEAAALRFGIDGPPALDRAAGEVFATLHPRERHLLLCAASEASLTAESARHLTRDPQAARVLAELELTGLLVSSHVPPATSSAGGAAAEPTYTVHPLLREVARRRLQAGGVDVQRARSTVARAAETDLAEGRQGQALARLVAVGAHAEATRLIADQGSGMVLRGDGDLIHSYATAHPAVIDREPSTWMALGLDRWIHADVAAARRWINRVIAHRGSGPSSIVPVACMRLLRARAGLEPLGPAVAAATEVLGHQQEDPCTHEMLPLLLLELGACETWTRDLRSAQAHLSAAATIGRAEDLPAVTARALSQLALVEFGLGREPGSAALAIEALNELHTHSLDLPPTEDRVHLVLDLVRLQRPPWPGDGRPGRDAGGQGRQPVVDPESQVRVVDPATRVWARIAQARHLLFDGKLLEAERRLAMPVTTPPLPSQLEVAALLERALHAMVAADASALGAVARILRDSAAPAEASLVLGLRADMAGDLAGSIELLRTASQQARTDQPPIGPIADVARAQLLAARGAVDDALETFRRALRATEVRANAMPFLGWSRHGVTVGWLLEGILTSHGATPWVRELAESLTGQSDITQHLRLVTATPREQSGVAEPAMMPQLSPRERVVLRELARGSSYADMADDLVISANTVKTHVKSLYEKLGVNRRSDALAVARSRHLL